MKREDLKVGMKVTFGRPGGERASGEIVKLSATRAKVISLEPWLDHPMGSLWNVPYFLLEIPAVENDSAAIKT